ncbi:MAG: Xaa-Pro peptidase family protein [bacterium]|nr:Xaa-Pro peptidase family protein [bacterium]
MNSERIDHLMGVNGIDWVVVEGSGSATSLFYLTRGAHIGSGIFLKEKGKSPILVHIDMERDNVKHLKDFNLVSFSSLNLRELNQIKDPVERGFSYYLRIFEKFGVKGKVYFQGERFNNVYLQVFKKISSELKDIEFPPIKEDIVYNARRQKTEEEIEKIKSVAARTQEAFLTLVNYLKGLKRLNGYLEDNGKPFTIGMARGFLRNELIKRGLLDSSGMIIAQGRDGGVPHNHGNDEEPIRVGVPIVFDIYPKEYGGGFYFDMTRTYSFGEPSNEVIDAYEQVRYIQEEAVKQAKVGKACKELEELVVNYFESKGHDTLRKNPQAQEGYVHSLGHGVGLDVHELPVINLNSEHTLEKGDVFTIEPGLYYPSKGFGIRIEDTLYIDGDGNTINLTYVPKDLVL